jgi:hypothetical protein
MVIKVNLNCMSTAECGKVAIFTAASQEAKASDYILARAAH